MIETNTIRAPAHWAPALINGDTSGLTDEEEKNCLAWANDLAAEGWRVIDAPEESEFASIRMNGTPFNGDVLTYVIIRSVTR